MSDAARIVLGVLMLIVLLVIVGLSVKGCADCTARGGAWVEPKAGWPVCVERLP